MRYLKWKLSQGKSGTGPEGPIYEAGGIAVASWAVDVDGYRIGYASDDADLTGGPWQVVDVSEADALAFCQSVHPDAVLQPDGTFTTPLSLADDV